MLRLISLRNAIARWNTVSEKEWPPKTAEKCLQDAALRAESSYLIKR